MTLGLTLVAPPTSEPLQLSDVKSYLRVDFDDDDALIAALITAAREYVESYTCRALMTQTYRMTLDAFPDDNGPIYIPAPPLQQVTSVTYVDVNGVTQTMTKDVNFFLDSDSEPARICIMPGTTWPTTKVRANVVTINFVAGYQDAGQVPNSIVLAMRLLVSHWYENRDIMVDGRLSETPFAVNALLDPFRVWRFV
jgi:uncharacterized phiE125 gp8 family phage protein